MFVIYAGFTIPKRSNVMVCPGSVHLNPTVYKDPNVFNPWRWKVCELRELNLPFSILSYICIKY
jgi:cytochrome P450